MTGTISIHTSRVPALNALGEEVTVERQIVTLDQQGHVTEVGRQYQHDHSHVNVRDDGVLVVLATGEELRLCTQD